MQSKNLTPGDGAWLATINACDVAGLPEVSRDLCWQQAMERAARARSRPNEFNPTCDTSIKPAHKGAAWQRALQMLAVLQQQSAKLDSVSHRQHAGEVLLAFEQSTKSPGGSMLGEKQTSEGARAAILELQRRTSSRPGPIAPARNPQLTALLRADMPRPRREVPGALAAATAIPAAPAANKDYAAAAVAAAALANAAVAAVVNRTQGPAAAAEMPLQNGPLCHS